MVLAFAVGGYLGSYADYVEAEEEVVWQSVAAVYDDGDVYGILYEEVEVPSARICGEEGVLVEWKGVGYGLYANEVMGSNMKRQMRLNQVIEP